MSAETILQSVTTLQSFTKPKLRDIIYKSYDVLGKRRPKFLWKFNKPGLIKFIIDEEIEF